MLEWIRHKQGLYDRSFILQKNRRLWKV